MIDTDAIAPEVTKLIELFSQEPSLKFPDLDAGALKVAAARVAERHQAVQAVEASLQAALAALEEEQEALLKKAQRAQAYLRIYAENDAALLSVLEAIVLPRSRRVARAEPPAAAGEGAPLPRKRGRPRKLVATADSLFAPDGGEAAVAAQ